MERPGVIRPVAQRGRHGCLALAVTACGWPRARMICACGIRNRGRGPACHTHVPPRAAVTSRSTRWAGRCRSAARAARVCPGVHVVRCALRAAPLRPAQAGTARQHHTEGGMAGRLRRSRGACPCTGGPRPPNGMHRAERAERSECGLHYAGCTMLASNLACWRLIGGTAGGRLGPAGCGRGRYRMVSTGSDRCP